MTKRCSVTKKGQTESPMKPKEGSLQNAQTINNFNFNFGESSAPINFGKVTDFIQSLNPTTDQPQPPSIQHQHKRQLQIEQPQQQSYPVSHQIQPSINQHQHVRFHHPQDCQPTDQFQSHIPQQHAQIQQNPFAQPINSHIQSYQPRVLQPHSQILQNPFAQPTVRLKMLVRLPQFGHFRVFWSEIFG